MPQKDFFLREVEKIGTIVMAIRQRLLGGGKEQLAIEIAQQKEAVSAELLHRIDFDLTLFLSLAAAAADSYIASVEGFNTENCEILADSLALIGRADLTADALPYLEKALLLYERCNRVTQTFSFDRSRKIDEVEAVMIQRK